MKWLFFRTVSLANDDGFVSAQSGVNSELRSSVLLRYDRLLSIIPYNKDANSGQIEIPAGGSQSEYRGVLLTFKPALSNYSNVGSTALLAVDKVYLEVNGQDAKGVCRNLISFIESSTDTIVEIADNEGSNTSGNAPGIKTCKHIELAKGVIT